MKDKRFEPRVLPVLAGRSVSFPNIDPVFDDVFSLSASNKADLGLYKDGNSKDHVFTTPGIVRAFCNIHPSMSAHVLVMQNPFWATVAADGSYRLPDIPPGTWTAASSRSSRTRTSSARTTPRTATDDHEGNR